MAVRATAAVEFGWVGFGYAAGLVPELRLGVVRFWWCQGSVMDHVKRLKSSLVEAEMELLELMTGRKR